MRCSIGLVINTIHDSRILCLWLVSICILGSGDSSVVRAPDSSSKSSVFESRQEKREKYLLHGHLSVLTHFGIRFTPVLPQ